MTYPRIFKDIGIVLRKIPYRDGQLMIQIFTKEHGLLHAVVRISSRGKIKPSFVQPLNILDVHFQAGHRPDLLSITEANPIFTLLSPIPSANVLFGLVQEICLKTIPPEHKDEKKFRLLEHFIHSSDSWNHKIPQDIVPLFLMDWTEVLGILPPLNEEISSLPASDLTGNKHEVLAKEIFALYTHRSISDSNTCQRLTEFWIIYLTRHFPELKNLKSVEVIRDLKYSLG